MRDGIAEADYCGLYKTSRPNQWVVVWEEFLPWIEHRGGLARCPSGTDTWQARGEVVAEFFRGVFIPITLPNVKACTVCAGLCTAGPPHLHVYLEEVVLEGEGVSHE